MKFLPRMLQQTLNVSETLDVLQRERRVAITECPVITAHGKNADLSTGPAKRFGSPLAATRPFRGRRQGYPLLENNVDRFGWRFSSCDPSPVVQPSELRCCATLPFSHATVNQ